MKLSAKLLAVVGFAPFFLSCGPAAPFRGTESRSPRTARIPVCPQPTEPLLTNVTSIQAGRGITCAVVENRLACWGHSDHGRLGDGSEGRRLRPVLAPEVIDLADVSHGNDTTFLRYRDGSIAVLGPNRGGEFGDGSADYHIAWTPRKIHQWGTVKQIRGGIPSCALRLDGKVECAGHPRFRRMNEDRTVPTGHPALIAGLSDIVSVAAGSGFTCVLRRDGAVFCWGMNDHGQLGIGSGDDEEKPVRVKHLDAAAEIVAGESTACARLVAGGVACWGRSLSDYEREPPPNWEFPTPIEGTNDAKQIALGDRVACALIRDGSVRCWGESSYNGQLGDGTEETRPALALPVACVKDAVQVTVGDNHSCAALRNGTAQCWGSGPYGAIGNGSPEDSPMPSFVLAAEPPQPAADRCPPSTTFRRQARKEKPEETEELCAGEDGKPEGHYVSRWQSGGILEEGDFLHGERHGKWIVHYEHGEVVSENHYDNGIPVGIWIAYSLHYQFAFATCFERGQKKWQVTSERELRSRSCP